VSVVKAHIERGGPVGVFTYEVFQLLSAAKEEFMIAPDEFVDVGRLPASVTSLDTLISYLRTIKTKLSNRDNKVKTEDWEVAKSGELRLYKLYVCCIHALYGYAKGSPDINANPTMFSAAVITHARSSQPPNLAKNGATLWQKTFSDAQPRTQAVVKSLLYFCMRETAARPPAPPADDKKGKTGEDHYGGGDPDDGPDYSGYDPNYYDGDDPDDGAGHNGGDPDDDAGDPPVPEPGIEPPKPPEDPKPDSKPPKPSEEPKEDPSVST
jgi:hypothetical protein